MTSSFFSAVFCLLLSFPLIASDRFITDDSTGVITDTVTDLEWVFAPDIEVDWFEAFIWLQELGNEWRCPSIYELSELFEAGISLDSPDPFVFSGNFVWCGDLSDFDSVYCFDFSSGYIVERIAVWNAYEYISGFRAFAAKSPVN